MKKLILNENYVFLWEPEQQLEGEYHSRPQLTQGTLTDDLAFQSSLYTSSPPPLQGIQIFRFEFLIQLFCHFWVW